MPPHTSSKSRGAPQSAHPNPDLPGPVRSAWPVLAVLLATLLASAGSMFYAQHISSPLDDAASSVATNAAPAIRHLSGARSRVLRLQLPAASAAGGKMFDRDEFKRTLTRFHQELAAYLQLPFYPEERERFLLAEPSFRAFDAEAAALEKALESGPTEQTLAQLNTRFLPAAARAVEALDLLIDFNAEQQARLGAEITAARRHANRMEMALEGTTSLLALALMAVVMGARRRYLRLVASESRLSQEHARACAEFAQRLEKLIGASGRIAAVISAVGERKKVFQTIADEARDLIGAPYSAVGCGTDPTRAFDPWVHSGVAPEIVQRLGRSPRPIGLFAAVIEGESCLRLDDLRQHPAFGRLPPGHPPLGPFLGIPIVREGRNVGNLFLAREPGAPPFTEDDERTAVLLAGYVGVAIVNAGLFEKARAATQAREDLLATVSHDLRSPLNAVAMAARLLPESTPPQTATLIARISRSSDRMARLIEDLLDSAKIEAGVLRVATTSEDVEGLQHAAAEPILLPAAQKEIRMTIVPPPAPLTVRCERGLILRVFANLLGNAVKFSPEGTEVSLEAARVDDAVRFTVRDQGPGIPPALLPHVFDRYWQQNDTDRRGSGLGLYIVKGIVEAHGGRIWIDSAPGEGTAIHFTLPTASSASAAPSQLPEHEPRDHGIAPN